MRRTRGVTILYLKRVNGRCKLTIENSEGSLGVVILKLVDINE